MLEKGRGEIEKRALSRISVYPIRENGNHGARITQFCRLSKKQEQAFDTLRANLNKAVEKLGSLLDSESETIELKAVQTILDYHIKFAEISSRQECDSRDDVEDISILRELFGDMTYEERVSIVTGGRYSLKDCKPWLNGGHEEVD